MTVRHSAGLNAVKDSVRPGMAGGFSGDLSALSSAGRSNRPNPVVLRLSVAICQAKGNKVSQRILPRKEPGCLGATEQKTGLSKFQATSSRTLAVFVNGRNSPRVTASGTEKA